MPSKIVVKSTRSKDPSWVKIGLSFEFAADDPQAEHIYTGLGLLMKEALTPEEAHTFMERLAEAKAKLVKTSKRKPPLARK